MISFQCPACGKKLKVKDEFAGKKGKCPKCGNVINIPALGEGEGSHRTRFAVVR